VKCEKHSFFHCCCQRRFVHKSIEAFPTLAVKITIIDCFSKMAWVVPLLTISADRVTDTFEKVLASVPKCAMQQTDRDKQFLNEKFQSMLQRHNIHFYTSDNYDIKAAVVERFNPTLKTKMYKYFTFKNRLRYIDVLRDLVDSYNATYHRSIEMAPNDVNATNEQLVRSRLYPPKKNRSCVGISQRAISYALRRHATHRSTKVTSNNGRANCSESSLAYPLSRPRKGCKTCRTNR